jgi:PKD repeat protein
MHTRSAGILLPSLLLLAAAAAYTPRAAADTIPAATLTAAVRHAPELGEDKTEAALPYTQSFDNEHNDYDGTGYLPAGWLTTGTTPFVTASINGLSALTGTYYMISPESTVARDERAYTPFFLMEAGKAYTISFHYAMPGDGTKYATMRLTAGTEQDSDFHSDLLTLGGKAVTGWEKAEVTFTPAETDYYCLSFALEGEAQSGYVAVEDLSVVGEGMKLPPTAAFSFDGVYNLMNSSLATFANTSLQMVNQSQDADSYFWEVNGPTQKITTADANPAFKFTEDGEYTITLTATNKGGETNAEETLKVAHVTEDGSLPVYNYNMSQSTIVQSDMPTFPTDTAYDYVTGFNHHYRHLAEYFDMPTLHTYAITGMYYYLINYNLVSTYTGTEPDKKISFVAYGVKDGKPDTENEFGRYTTTLRESIGSTGVAQPEMRMISFKQPLTVKGPFFLALEFADDITLDPDDAQLTRSYIALSGVKRRTGTSSLYVRPTSVPEGATCTADGAYHAIDELDSTYAGWGLNLTLWMNTTLDPSAGIAVASGGSTALSAAFDGGTLRVDGTAAGGTVRIYDTLGRSLLSVPATQGTTSLPATFLPAGTYVVKTDNGCVKLMKH